MCIIMSSYYMKRVIVNLTDALLKGLDELVREGKYPNRSEAIRNAIRDLIKAEGKWRP
uniref:Putative ribbon-helix-helix protein repressor n=1 Tax=viral metagenome TaxID=1070528 RepID=A0A6M3Y087_9ZZZZ